MRTIKFNRPSRQAVLKAAVVLVLSFPLIIIIDHKFHPDRFLLPSAELSAVPFNDFFWLDFVAGNFFQLRSKEISPLPDLIVRPSRPCKASSFLVAMVTSPPGDFQTRELIRNTWGGAVMKGRWPTAELRAAVEMFFVLGTTSKISDSRLVHEEAEKHEDLIVGNFVDAYRNLTLKTLTGLNWVSRYCARTKFVMKVDQDTLVDFPRLTNFLLQQEPRLRNAVIGKLYFNSKRLTKGKWKVTDKEYPFSLYPTFAGGPCYLISTDVVGRMVNASRFLPFFAMEDVQVTGVVAKAMGVRRLYLPHLRNWNFGESLCVLMDQSSHHISLTELNRDMLQHAWRSMTKGTCLPYKASVKS